MRIRLAALVLALAAGGRAGSLYEQSIVRMLEQRFREEEISYLLIDAPTKMVIASKWVDAEEPAAVGSLVKPFTALVYGELHGFRYPEYVCGSGCWLPRGHGRVGIVAAIAHSCNAYFRALAAAVPSARVCQFGIERPEEGSDAATLAGLGEGWRISPLALARAYSGLPERTGAREILLGMALSAWSGTGRGISRALGEAALAKTGTAPCAHKRRATGDGYAVALHPPERPQVTLLVRVHGTTGAQASIVAGRMLHIIVKGR